MPIYEFACPKCRRIYNFLSKRVSPSHLPTCPKCGNKKLVKEVSRFAMITGAAAPADGEDDSGEPMPPDFDDPKIEQAMAEMERDVSQMDEHNPKHMAIMLRRMKELMPAGTMPKDMDTAIHRLEAGEDPDKIEEDMGDVMETLMAQRKSGGKKANPGYVQDPGLYDY